MAGLREIAKEYQDEIMDGIAWVAIWKTGRSWHAQAFWLNEDTDRIEDEDMEEARAIVAADDKAIFINEYYTAHMGDGKLDEIVEGIRSQYESGGYLLTDHTAYVSAEEAAQLAAELEDLKNSKTNVMNIEIKPWEKAKEYTGINHEITDGYREEQYEEYSPDGTKRIGTEDFTTQRLRQIRWYWVYTPTGEKDKGGHIRWKLLGIIRTLTAREAKIIAKLKYGRYSILQIRNN